MLGVIFVEFMEMVSERYSPDMADRIIEAGALESGGAYTAVGNYNHSEILHLVAELSRQSGDTVDTIMVRFGRSLFNGFISRYPELVPKTMDVFKFLEQIDGDVHVEILRRYPDAELPKITTERLSDREFNLIYQSVRPFSLVAKGLMQGVLAHFDRQGQIISTDLSVGANHKVLFQLILDPD